jgi:hypothetical protein
MLIIDMPRPFTFSFFAIFADIIFAATPPIIIISCRDACHAPDYDAAASVANCLRHIAIIAAIIISITTPFSLTPCCHYYAAIDIIIITTFLPTLLPLRHYAP